MRWKCSQDVEIILIFLLYPPSFIINSGTPSQIKHQKLYYLVSLTLTKCLWNFNCCIWSFSKHSEFNLQSQNVIRRNQEKLVEIWYSSWNWLERRSNLQNWLQSSYSKSFCLVFYYSWNTNSAFFFTSSSRVWIGEYWFQNYIWFPLHARKLFICEKIIRLILIGFVRSLRQNLTHWKKLFEMNRLN